MRVIRTLKPRTGAGGAASSAPAPAPKKPHAPDPLEPSEEGAPVPGEEAGRAAEESGRTAEEGGRATEETGRPDRERVEEPEHAPGDEDLVPDE